MKNVITVALFMLVCLNISAQESANNGETTQKKQSNFHFQADLQTKYIWRGMEMQIEDAAPVIFPQINYQSNGLYAYVMGGTALNGKYSEFDFGVSYNKKWLTVGLNDYYYPAVDNIEDQYSNFKKGETGHWVEGFVTISPENIPAYMTVSNFFYGADRYFDDNGEEKQAYSTYVELGTWYDFADDHKLAFTAGLACNKSCYNGFEHGFGVCNLELKYTYSLKFKNGWSLPLSAAAICNPVYNKTFMNFSTSITF